MSNDLSLDHPTIQDLKGFLRIENQPESAAGSAAVVRHLLAECSLCRKQLEAMGWGAQRLERLLYLPGTRSSGLAELVPVRSGYNYNAAFVKAERAVEGFLAEALPSERPVQELWAELEAHSPEEQVRLVTSERRFAHPEIIRQLIDRSHAARYSDPTRMLHLAELARLAAMSVSAQVAGGDLRLADLRAQSWRQYGNALRVCGRLPEAERAFVQAQVYFEQGTGDPRLRACLLEHLASLRIFQRQFESANELAEEAGQIYRELGEAHSLAGTMVRKAIASLYAGDAETAARTLNNAIPLIDHEEDPHLLLAACHNLIYCYTDLDKPEQALSLYSEARDLYQEFQDVLIALRASWQEGRLLRDLGHLRAAESALLRARRGFVERSLAYEVAVVSLDLAAVYIKLNEVEKVQQMVAETVPIFRALRVDRDALASLLQLQQIASQGQKALELIRLLSSQLEKFSHRQVA